MTNSLDVNRNFNPCNRLREQNKIHYADSFEYEQGANMKPKDTHSEFTLVNVFTVTLLWFTQQGH